MRVDLRFVGEVALERDLTASPSRHSGLVDQRCVVAAQSQHPQVRTDGRAEATSELVMVGGGEVGDGDDAELGESRRDTRADPRDRGHRLGAHHRQP